MKKDKLQSFEDYKKQIKRRKNLILTAQISILILFFALWELLAYTGVINVFLVSKPTDIFNLFIQYVKQGTLFDHLSISISETLLGLIIGTILGLIIATILYLFETLSKICEPYLVVLNALPKTALAPILIIWAGTGVKGIVVVSVSLSLVITVISAYSYFISVDQSLIKMLKTFKASRWQILTKVIYPSNIANLLSLIKINIGLSWIGVIVGEFLVSRGGLGYLIVYGGQVFKLDLVMMGVILLAIIALLMYESVNLLEYYFRHHHHRKRKEKRRN